MSAKYGLRVNWETFKGYIDAGIPFKEVILPGSLRLIAIDGDSQWQCIIHIDGDMPTEYAEYQATYEVLKNKPIVDRDSGGRTVNRYAATKKGWHYQAHSISFEVGLKDSLYNKDDEGNDLGFTSITFFDENGVDITNETQQTIDTTAKKTVVKWCPTYDFEVISGSIRQISKKSSDIFLYVNARVPTGYPAPNDWLKVPFVQGGVNLNYIGADEPLKTDGRAAKLFQGSLGAHFEVIINHDTMEKHKVTVIFETYKDPLV